MRILVGCEESQEITKAFRELGHEAYSCDLLPCSGGHPEWHLQMDVFNAIELIKPTLGIFHPPCDYLSKAGARWMHPGGMPNVDPERFEKALNAKRFFLNLYNQNIPYIAIENPRPLKSVFKIKGHSGLPKETQVIQPYHYGHPFSKATQLWLRGLPKLEPTNILTEYTPFLPSNTGGKKRGQKATFVNISKSDSSKTFPGIAKAMAEQWGNL
jgi:hypothetical protein